MLVASAIDQYYRSPEDIPMAFRHLIRTTIRSRVNPGHLSKSPGHDYALRPLVNLARKAPQDRLACIYIASHTLGKNYSTTNANRQGSGTAETRMNVSEGADSSAVMTGVKELVESGKWAPTDDAMGIQRTVSFKGFKGCWVRLLPLSYIHPFQRHHNPGNSAYLRDARRTPPFSIHSFQHDLNQAQRQDSKTS